MTLDELAVALDAESMGGRLIVVIDDKRTYITDIGDDGQPFLNALGLQMHNDAEAAAANKPAKAPKAKKADTEVAPVAEVATTDDVQIEV